MAKEYVILQILLLYCCLFSKVVTQSDHIHRDPTNHDSILSHYLLPTHLQTPLWHFHFDPSTQVPNGLVFHLAPFTQTPNRHIYSLFSVHEQPSPTRFLAADYQAPVRSLKPNSMLSMLERWFQVLLSTDGSLISNGLSWSTFNHNNTKESFGVMTDNLVSTDESLHSNRSYYALPHEFTAITLNSSPMEARLLHLKQKCISPSCAVVRGHVGETSREVCIADYVRNNFSTFEGNYSTLFMGLHGLRLLSQVHQANFSEVNPSPPNYSSGEISTSTIQAHTSPTIHSPLLLCVIGSQSLATAPRNSNASPPPNDVSTAPIQDSSSTA